jgi:hypothetical protein
VKEVFPSLLRQQKWFKYKRDTRVEDVVLRKDETAAGQTYKYARVTKVHVRTDSKVRAADIEYKVPGEARFRSTTRPIHKLVLVVPVEEQVIEEDEGGEVGQDPEAGGEYGEENDGVQWGGDEDGEEVGGTGDGNQLSQEETAKESKEKAQGEEASSQLSEEPHPATPGVQFSDGLEEMVDVGTAVKRGRGRPKKVGTMDQLAQKETDPLDPHKGSVTDSAEGVCVDPGESGAILEVGGPGPPGAGKGGQLASDSGGG